jgi:acyl-CoA synthetase (AMP-forming)/AMP-acid ligase II/thioesterase domain-containing protein/acyl carrier protein
MPEQTIQQLILRAAPERPALLAPGRAPLTYAGLAQLISETGAALNERGLGAGDRVALLAPNGPEAAAAFLAISANAACGPLNPAYSERELEFYLTDLRAKAVVIAAGLDTPAETVARRLGAAVLHLKPGNAAAGAFTLHGPAGGDSSSAGSPRESDTALLLHTSGTTSRPKLVPLSHRNLCASAGNIAHTLALTPADRCLNVMPLFHIHGLAGALMSSCYAGASVVCTPGLLVTAFFEWLEQLEPTWYTAVPTMHQSILARAQSHLAAPPRHRLRLARSSSASLAPKLMQGIEELFGVPVIESYGMTEAAHQMASNPLPPLARKPGSVGLRAGPAIAILDETGSVLPPGTVGEVVIRGENVTAGYEANPEANRAAFTDGWFRTGDQGRFDEEGYLFLVGRLKELINRGGEKIAPQEIDDALMEHPGVALAVAFAVPHERLGEEVGVAIVPRPGAALTQLRIQQFVAERLADFKVPRVVRFVEEIPKGPTGKLQRIGLAAALGVDPIRERRVETREKEAPRNDAERKMAEIWREVLKIPEVGIDEDFFALGGDSLLAAVLTHRIAEVFGAEPPLLVFRTAPTVAGMVAAIERGGKREDGLVVLREEGGEPPVFCVAGHGGRLLGLTNLAHHLPPGRPVLALPPPRGGKLHRIEDLAADYVETVLARQPEGPHILFGHCFGGFVAFEMACLLRSSGREVGLLAMLECFNRGWFDALSPAGRAWVRLRHAVRRAAFHGRRIASRPPREAFEHLRRRWEVVREVRREMAVQQQYEACVLEGREIAAEMTRQRSLNRAALTTYAPGTYDGPALLIAPAAPRANRYPAPLLGWGAHLSGPAEMIEVDDGLAGMLAEPAVQEVGRLVGLRLERSRAGVA